MLHGRRNLPFFGNLAEKASCVDDKNETVWFRYTYSYIVFPYFASNPYHNVIRPYHLKKGQNPYWIRKIRTRWHVCKWDNKRSHILHTESMNTSHGDSAKLCSDLVRYLLNTSDHSATKSTKLSNFDKQSSGSLWPRVEPMHACA